MILSIVCFNFSLASLGILYNLLCNPSLTKEFNEKPKMLDSQILEGFSSNSFNKYETNSSDCCSDPTIGVISVVIFVFKR